MMIRNLEVIKPGRIRKIRGSFSWIEHEFVNRGIIDMLTKEELLLYYFLVSVGDKRGVSFYGRDKICGKIKIGIEQYEKAKQSLVEYDLIAYKPFNSNAQNGYFQVLSLPERKVNINEFIKERIIPNISA
ncbi:MAG: hypothetical protein U9O91_08210 [Candidatus Caldatribacteriota bacterium]|nr:hypothetical protein [Candidatus Caldatribacteriota bacterium]